MNNTTSLEVEGMACEHCETAVKKAVNDLNGISSVEVDLEKKAVTVTYDSVAVSLEDIIAAIEDQGYDVV